MKTYTPEELFAPTYEEALYDLKQKKLQKSLNKIQVALAKLEDKLKKQRLEIERLNAKRR